MYTIHLAPTRGSATTLVEVGELLADARVLARSRIVC